MTRLDDAWNRMKDVNYIECMVMAMWTIEVIDRDLFRETMEDLRWWML